MEEIPAIFRKVWAIVVLIVAAIAMWNAIQNVRTAFA